MAVKVESVHVHAFQRTKDISRSEAQQMADDYLQFTVSGLLPLTKWACKHPHLVMKRDRALLVLADTGDKWVVCGGSDAIITGTPFLFSWDKDYAEHHFYLMATWLIAVYGGAGWDRCEVEIPGVMQSMGPLVPFEPLFG